MSEELTAAGVYGWWLPPLPQHLPVFACQSVDDPRPRRTGLRVTRHPQPLDTRVEHGLRVAAPAEVLLVGADRRCPAPGRLHRAGDR